MVRNLLFSPLWLYAILSAFYLSFEGNQQLLLSLVLLVLGFPHFAMTFPLVFHSAWKDYEIKVFDETYSGWTIFILLPAVLMIMFSVGYFINADVAIIVFMMTNVFHITRQSEGIFRLLGRKQPFEAIKIGLLYLRISNYLILLMLILMGFGWKPLGYEIFLWLIITFAFLSYLFIKTSSTALTLNLLTGGAIYSPIFFTTDPLAILVLGTSMHYVQYLAVSYRVLSKRLADGIHYLFDKGWLIFSFLVTYCGISYYLSFGLTNREIAHGLVLLPMLAQLYHFITDAFIWRRKNIVNEAMNMRYL